MHKLAVAVITAVALASSARAAITPAEKARLEAAATVTQDIHGTIPAEYWGRAHCVVVIPEVKKAALVIGGEYGKGVMSCRAGSRWSAPVFMQLAKGSWGFQAGAEQVDVVLLVMNEDGAQKLLQDKVNLGADASIAAGPIGRQGQIGTDSQLKAEMISYSHAQGLFAGIDLSGGVLRPDDEANRNTYGSRATPRSILASREISAPVEAQGFLNALGKGSAPAASERNRDASSSTPSPRATTLATTDDDIRVRVVNLQQAVDRLLAEPAATGTSGAAGAVREGGTVTIARAQLAQIRQQLDALLASLNRR